MRPLQRLMRDIIILDSDRLLFGAGTETERCLAPTNHFYVDFGEQFGVEKRAVFGAVGVVDPVTPAKCVEGIRTHRVLAACKRKRIRHQFR
ncbi:hypothetical protein D3C72_2159400 [compost metagenome]